MGDEGKYLKTPGPLWILMLFAASTPAPAIAPGNEVTEPTIVARTEYSDQNAPLGIRLKVFLQRFDLELDEREMLIRSSLVKGGFPTNELSHLFSYFEKLYNRINTEVDSSIREIACRSEASEFSADQVRAIFNAMDDLRDGTFEKYVGIASGELAALAYVDFPDRLKAMSYAFVDVKLDNRGVTDQKILDGRKTVCRHLNVE